MDKIQVYHFHNGHGGGVLSVIKILLQYSTDPSITNHIIYTINKDLVKEYTFIKCEGAATEEVFYYSPRWNFYYTCQQLAKLLPDDKAIIVAHDGLELGMVSNLGLQNSVIQIVHGNYDYYYELAIKNSSAVNAFICISRKIFQSLQERLPLRKDNIFYLNFPVAIVKAGKKINKTLHIIYYVGNLKDINKQFSTIIAIASQLSDAAIDYFFTIAGGGMTVNEFFEVWPVAMKESVNYKGLQTNEEIIAMLPNQDIFLLPSLAEGLPVSLVETMKAGVVPLVTNWEGAVDELVSPGITGYYFNIGAFGNYADCIRNLQHDRILLNQLSQNCIQRANTLFDPVNNTRKFEELYKTVDAKNRKKKNPIKVYGSRLDQTYLPNAFVKLIRTCKKKS